MSTGETGESQSGYEDGGGGGPGAPTPLSALEVLWTSVLYGPRQMLRFLRELGAFLCATSSSLSKEASIQLNLSRIRESISG